MSDFADKVRSLGFVGSKPGIQDVRDASGKLVGRSVTDDNNTTITERDTGVDVVVRPKPANIRVVINGAQS